MSPRALSGMLLRRLYHDMLRIRLIEERIGELYAEQQMTCPCHFSIGQEAVAVGACASLNADDLVFGTYRGHALYLAKGGSLKALVAELYGKETGCAKGRGGSMQLLAPEAGFVFSSAIVGGTIPSAVGGGWAASLRKTGQVSLAVFGDGATEEGVFHESLNFASLHRLPVVFVCENNFYACYSHQRARQPADNIWKRAAAYGMPGVRVDGNDVATVYRAVAQAARRARAGQGPSLIECRTYRWREHVGPADDTGLGYRSRAELRRWQARCPIKRLSRSLMRRRLMTDRHIRAWTGEIQRELEGAVAFAKQSPFPAADRALDGVYAAPVQRMEQPKAATRSISFCAALQEGMAQAMERDPSVILAGEGVDDPRAIFGSTRGLKERFGDRRVFDIPLSENGMTGILMGAALGGLRPVMTHQRLDFMLYSMDQLVNHAAKRSYASGGRQSVPLTIRAIVGRGWGQGPQHSQSLQAWFAHAPGLKVIMPSTPFDAKGLLLAAIQDPNPVICIEYRKLYDATGLVPETPYTIPLGQGIVRHEGTDVTVVATSYMAVEALRALPALTEAGMSVELIDPRTIKPLDEALILRSVEKTGRLVVADTGWAVCGVSAEISAIVAERAFSSLKAPVRRVALPDSPAPTSFPLEQAFYPGAEAIIEAVWDVMGNGRSAKRSKPSPKPRREPAFAGPF